MSALKDKTDKMTPGELAAFLQSHIETIFYTYHSIIYFYKTDPTVVWKSDSLWVDGMQFGKLTWAEDTSAQLRHEYNIYQTLGSHPRIAKCLGLEEDKSGNAIALRFERAPRLDLRHFMEANTPLPPAQRVGLAVAFAEGVQHLHACKVMWGDVSTRNTLVYGDVGDEIDLRLCDFGSSVLEGVYPEFGPYTYETRYLSAMSSNDSDQLSMYQQELYALGSAIYEIIEWEKPYAKLEDLEVSSIVCKGSKSDDFG